MKKNNIYTVTRKFVATLKLKKVVSICLIVNLMLVLTGCGEASSKSRLTTEEYSTEEEVGNEVDEPNQEIAPGAMVGEDETTETTTEEATTEQTAEPQDASNNSGSYTYDVDGVQITMRTNVDDYIVQNQYGGYDFDLIALASSLGFHYEGLHPNEPEYQYTFYQDSNTGTSIGLEEEQDQYFYKIGYYYGSNEMDYNGFFRVSFVRNDKTDESITSYWVSTSNNSNTLVNYEQIIIIAYLMENATFEPRENWMEDAGFSTTQDGYLINN